MDTTTLVQQIIDISHNESAPDTALQQQALQWLNSAYHEVMDELMPFMPRFIEQDELHLTNAEGMVTLSRNLHQLKRVVDVDNGRTLPEVTLQNLMDIDPKQAQIGVPLRAFITGKNTLQLHPKQEDVRVRVLYVPEVQDLQENTDAADILLPEPYHHALVWGGLVWSSIYERGFSSQGDLALFQRKWDDAKRNMKLSLASNRGQVARVQPHEWL